MRRTVLVGLAVLAIAGCGSAASTTPASPPLPSSPSASSPHPASSPALAAFGTARQVTDDQGRPLTVTPVTAWWLPGDIQSRYDPNAARYGLASCRCRKPVPPGRMPPLAAGCSPPGLPGGGMIVCLWG
jgi:hypothetical protein